MDLVYIWGVENAGVNQETKQSCTLSEVDDLS
jgi:hypothetical protein